MWSRSRSLNVSSSCFLLLFAFVIGEIPPPWIECTKSHSSPTINPTDCRQILSRLPALHFHPFNQHHEDKVTLSLPLARPYRVPARITYGTCAAEFMIWTAEEFLDHWLAEAPLTDEQMAFYFWPEARKQGTAVIEECLVRGHKRGAGYGTLYVPQNSQAHEAFFYQIMFKASSNEDFQLRRPYRQWHLYNARDDSSCPRQVFTTIEES